MSLDGSISMAGLPGTLETATRGIPARDELAELVADLFDRFQPAIFSYLCRLVGTRDVAEELTQETFLRAHNARFKLPEVANRRAWLYRIATNLGLNAIKRQAHFTWLSWGDTGRASACSEDAYAQVRQRSALEQALATLPPQYLAPLWLYSHEGFTVSEVAQAVGISEGAVKVRLHRAREKFKQIYLTEESV